MRGLRQRPVLNAVLCAVLLAGSTSTSVCHTHERGLVPHAHGFGPGGWAGSGTVTSDAATPHAHLVVLGVELFGESLPSPLDPTQRPSDVQLALGLGVAADVPSGDPLPVHRYGSPATIIAPSACLPFAAARVPAAQDRDSMIRNALCDSARGERSGVLLA